MLWKVTTDTNNLPSIIDLARKATTLRPDVANNWQTLARLLLRTGKNEETIAVLAEAISKLPAEPKLHLMLADAHYRARRFGLVHEVLGRAPPVPIEDREMTIFRLELLMKTRAVKAAARLAADTLALDPTNVEALTVLGQALRENGNPEIMVPICQAALSKSHCTARPAMNWLSHLRCSGVVKTHGN